MYLFIYVLVWDPIGQLQVQGDDRNQTSQDSDDVDYEGDSTNHLKISKKIYEQHTGKARSQGTTRHSKHAGESAKIRVQNIQHGK